MTDVYRAASGPGYAAGEQELIADWLSKHEPTRPTGPFEEVKTTFRDGVKAFYYQHKKGPDYGYDPGKARAKQNSARQAEQNKARQAVEAITKGALYG